MFPPNWRTLLVVFLFCFCVTLPFDANGGEQSPSDAAPSPAPAAKTSSAPDEPSQAAYESATVLRATTRLVMIDVVAADSRGRAVLDLAAKDFTLLENGKQQTVRVFGLQRPRTPAELKAAALPVLPANVFTNIPRFKLGSSLNVVLLDALNTPVLSQEDVRRKMLHYLATMPNDSPTAVFTLGQRLRMVQDFTTDPSILKEAVKKAETASSPLLDNPIAGGEGDYFSSGFAAGVTSQGLAALQSSEAERISSQTDLRVRYTMDALQSIAHWLAGFQGRKNLIWISEGFPLSIRPEATVSPEVEFGAERSYAADVDRTAALLTDSQIAIYPVDARGLAPAALFSASSSGRDHFGSRISSGSQVHNELALESDNLTASHGAMEQLADRTGGKAYYNRNDLDGAVRDGLSDGSTYYQLGYYPENKEWNGKFRKVQVKVARPGIRLRYRVGYYAADPEGYAKEDAKQRARELGDAMSLEHPVSTALFFQARVLPPSQQSNNKVTVVYAVDSHALAVEHDNDGTEHANLECVVQAYSEKGKAINSTISTVNAAMKPETYKKVAQSGFPCRNEIALAEGNYFLRLGVRDTRTGLIGTANAKVNVAKAAESKPETK